MVLIRTLRVAGPAHLRNPSHPIGVKDAGICFEDKPGDKTDPETKDEWELIVRTAEGAPPDFLDWVLVALHVGGHQYPKFGVWKGGDGLPKMGVSDQTTDCHIGAFVGSSLFLY